MPLFLAEWEGAVSPNLIFKDKIKFMASRITRESEDLPEIL